MAADVYRQRPVADALIGDKLAESRRLVGAPGIVSEVQFGYRITPILLPP